MGSLGAVQAVHSGSERGRVRLSYPTDDPIADFYRHDHEQQKRLKELPVCCYCDDPIEDDFCYEINGEYYCEDCLDMHFRKAVDDLVI